MGIEDRPLISIIRGTQRLPFPEPSSYLATTATLVDGGRNVDGQMIGTRISEKAKVEMGWKFLTVADWARVNQFFIPIQIPPPEDSEPETEPTTVGGFVNEVEFFDQVVGDWVIRSLYVSDRSSGMWRRDPRTGEVLGWLDCKLSLIEV
jgi:hypothetical protein